MYNSRPKNRVWEPRRVKPRPGCRAGGFCIDFRCLGCGAKTIAGQPLDRRAAGLRGHSPPSPWFHQPGDLGEPLEQGKVTVTPSSPSCTTVVLPSFVDCRRCVRDCSWKRPESRSPTGKCDPIGMAWSAATDRRREHHVLARRNSSHSSPAVTHNQRVFFRLMQFHLVSPLDLFK